MKEYQPCDLEIIFDRLKDNTNRIKELEDLINKANIRIEMHERFNDSIRYILYDLLTSLKEHEHL